ncbi:MAG: folate-binding protein [Motiliproteus sp.]|nr:folate-binding protein [Motiliproteus sp.]MCW9053184.1 folate-binding protein [Motiliproteus sp.]
MTTSTWIDFLQSQGATVSGSDVEFSTADDNSNIQLMPLADYSLLAMKGPDTETFLQGQLSCDMGQLSEQQSILGSNCSPKGNVISVFRLLMLEPHSLFLRLPKSISEPALANLNKYIVFSKAELNDVKEEYVGLGVSGADSEQLISKQFDNCPEKDGQQLVKDGSILVRVPGSTPRFELWCPRDQAETLWQQLVETATATSSSEWRRQEIAAGLAVLDAESVEQYLPQMLNLQAVEGVSFDKGCYIGQEVITRLQFRGKLKKSLYRAQVNGSVQPQPGMSLHTENRKGVGKVLAAAANGDGYEIQAVIGKKSADSDQLFLDQQDGPTVELLPLPYQLDNELFER